MIGGIYRNSAGSDCPRPGRTPGNMVCLAARIFLLLNLILTPVMCRSVAGDTIQKSPQTEEELRALVKAVETQHRGDTSRGRMRMNISTRDWKRSLVMDTWSEGRDRFLARVVDPAKERGTCTLKVKEDIWNFFPKIDRLVKIPSSLMGDRWMGSHFTNDDLVKEDKVDEMYDLSRAGGDEQTIIVNAVPRPNAAVVWGKLVYTIDLGKRLPISVDYFDETGTKVRTMGFDRAEMVSGRWVCLRMKIVPVETPQESTEVVFENLEFDAKIPGNLFSVQSLRRQ